MSDAAATLEALLAEEERLVFPHFDYQTAWISGDAWAERKSAVVERFGHSSYYVGCRYRADGKDFDTDARLDNDRFAAHGGAFPLIIGGTGPVGVIAVSGLPQAEDHQFVVIALERFLS